MPASGIDTGKLKGRLSAQEQKRAGAKKEGVDATVKALLEGPLTARKIRQKTGFRKERQDALLDFLVSENQITATETKARGNVCYEYAVKK